MLKRSGYSTGTSSTLQRATPLTDLYFQSVNSDGTFLVSQAFLRQLPEGTNGNIMTLTSSAAYASWPYWASYSLSKLSAMQQMAFIAAENPNVSAVSVSPGLVMTDSIQDVMKKFAIDTPMLIGGKLVWLCTEGARFMSGRYTTANWDVVELKEREKEIKEKDLLKICLSGTFGTEQFGGESEVFH
jgi:NAD(P)-dependent dehydrogenase (short-subunit alcohol dehydrogenase family)